MRVVYYSGFPFTDCDFPLIREFQNKGVDVRYYIVFRPDKPNGPLVSIKNPKPKSGIFKASEYEEFAPFKDYLDLDKVFVVNRIRKGGHPKNILLHLKLAMKMLFFRPDVVHVTFPLAGPEFPMYLLRRKMVLTVHDPEFHSGEGSLKMERQRKIAFSLTPKLVLLNKGQRFGFTRKYHIEKPILVNRLGAYDTLEALKGEPVQKGDYILHFGRISPYKGIDVLCEAMNKVRETIPSLRCIIAGGGQMYFDFKPYESNPNIELHNRYIPAEELGSLIDGSLFCVCPYTDATQSGVVSSAFAFNKPVIASNVGALGETVIDSVTGKLVPANDADALSAAIISLANDRASLESMSANILNARTSGPMSWKQIADNYLRFYL